MMERKKTFSAEEPTSESKFTEQFDRRFRRGSNASSSWRMQAREYYAAYGGNPWPDEAREILDSEGRPVTSFNYSLAHINAVLGQDIADRKEARFQGIGYEEQDSFAAEVLTNLVRSLYMKCNAHREETEAFQDQLVTGYGWTEVFLDTSKFPVWPSLSSVDAQEMYWDPDAKKNNLRDAKYVVRRKRWSLEDAIARWPGKKAELRRISKVSGDSSSPFPKTAHADGYRTGSGGKVEDPSLQEDGLYVYDYQFKKIEPWVVFKDPTTGRREKVPQKEFKAITETIFATRKEDGTLHEEIESAVLQLERVYRAFLAGKDSGGVVVIEKPAALETEMFTYRCATGYRSLDKQGRVVFFGLMAVIYEPQLWTAKALSAAIEHIAVSPKGGGGFINPDFLRDPADFKEHGATAGHWAFVNSGFDPKEHVYERKPPMFHQAYEKLFDLAESSMARLTTISDYFKGTSQQERSNVLVTNLQGQTMMVLNPLIDPMSQLRVENARLMAMLAQQHIAPDDFNRLVGEMEAEGVTFTIATDPVGNQIWQDGEPLKVPIPLLDEMGQPLIDEFGQPINVTPFDTVSSRDLLEFDVQVDLGPASPTQKQAIWQNWQQTAFAQKILELYPEVAEQVLPWLVKNSPGLSTDEAKRMEKSLRTALRNRQMQGTVQGVMESLQQLPPEAIQQIVQMGSAMLNQQMGGGEQPPQPTQ